MIHYFFVYSLLFSGDDFEYEICDGNGACAIAIVFIQVEVVDSDGDGRRQR